MNQPAKSQSYDLFKATVAVILFIILVWLLMRGSPSTASVPAIPATTQPVLAAAPVNPTTQPPATALPEQPNPTPTVEPAATSPPPSTPTPTIPVEQTAAQAPTAQLPVTGLSTEQTSPETPATAEPTVPASTEATLSSEQAATEAPVAATEAVSTPSATEVPVAATEAVSTPSVTETPAAAIEPGPVNCPLAPPTRLQVGDTVKVTSNLNMRAEAGILKKLIRSNPTGSELTLIGGPVCEPYQGGAYLWWQVQRPDGQSGWSAEAPLNGDFYFLDPVE